MGRIAINGFGRIGRLALRAILERAPDLDPVAVNDLASAKTNAHLFKYDSNYGRFDGEIEVSDNTITIDGRQLQTMSQRDWTELPWKDLDIDVVVEATGVGTDRASAAKHLAAGAKKVIISAPAKEEDITLGVGRKRRRIRPGRASHPIECFVYYELLGACGEGPARCFYRPAGPHEYDPFLYQ